MADLQEEYGVLTLNVMSEEKVRVRKLYGPAIFADLEFEASVQRESWIIYRNGVVWLTIPAQLDHDFQED